MIEEIRIKNFKSVQKLKFELGRINVIIGANGSGKSNLLEAITMGSIGLSDKVDLALLNLRGVRVTDSVYMRSAFKKENTEKDVEIDFKINKKGLNFKFYHNNKPFSKWMIKLKIPTLKGKTFMDSTDGENIVIDAINFFRGHPDTKQFTINSKEELSLKDFLIYAPENLQLRNFHSETQVEPLGTHGEGLFRLLQVIAHEKPEHLKVIREKMQLMDWFEDLDIPTNLFATERRLRVKDRFLAEDLAYFDQRSANEGFLYLLFYVTLFVSDYTPKFFAIDNLDNALNPKLCRKLMTILVELAKKFDKQVIFTTHNPAVLDGLNLNDDEQRLFIIQRNLDGHTKINRVKKKSELNGSSVRLSEQFLRGYLGGLPKHF
ncbi:MAG: AAA family ATPase [Saprospiraceae bacterium]